MERNSSPLETLTGLVVLIAVGAQTWLILQEATQGDAGRWAQRYWNRVLRPTIVRMVMWVDAKALIERMVTDEVTPLLEGDA